MGSIGFVTAIPLVSTNDMYCIGGRGNRKYIIKSSSYRKFETDLNKFLDEHWTDDQFNAFVDEVRSDKQNAIEFKLKLEIPSSYFFKSDCSNYIKPIEDVMKTYLEIDDARNSRVISEKHLSDKWSTTVELNIYKVDEDIPDGKW